MTIFTTSKIILNTESII